MQQMQKKRVLMLQRRQLLKLHKMQQMRQLVQQLKKRDSMLLQYKLRKIN